MNTIDKKPQEVNTSKPDTLIYSVENASKNASTIVNEHLKKKLTSEKEVYMAPRTSKLQRGKAELLLKKIQEELQLNDPEEALAVVAILFQQGGTARSCDGNMSTVVFGKECKLADIRRVLSRNSCKKAERKLARTLADEIRDVCLLLEIPGNLCLKIQKNNIERVFTIEEKVWLSDFQSDNENCPTELRKLIMDTFKKPEVKKKKK